MENFQAIADDFRAAGACVEIPDAAALAGAVERLLRQPGRSSRDRRRALGAAPKPAAAPPRAPSPKSARSTIPRVPRYRPAEPWFALRWALSRCGSGAAAAASARGLAAPAQARRAGDQRRQPHHGRHRQDAVRPAPGRAAEGARARSPGILTRGYGRGSPGSAHGRSRPAPTSAPEHSGDEPQIFVRSGLAPVGIGADRFQTGTRPAPRSFDVDVLLLDDGFQHVRLARDVDIVLIDALHPFGGGDLFPLGRLREPIEALGARRHRPDHPQHVLRPAGAPSSTRSAGGTVRRPIFRARVAAARLGGASPPAASSRIDDRPFDRAGAFCGLGNPQSFRRTLQTVGVDPVDWVEFDDHHRYRPHELERIARQMASHGARRAGDHREGRRKPLSRLRRSRRAARPLLAEGEDGDRPRGRVPRRSPTSALKTVLTLSYCSGC